MANLCQTDYEKARPTEYFPDTFRTGECDACGETTFVARATKAEVEAIKAEEAAPASGILYRCSYCRHECTMPYSNDFHLPRGRCYDRVAGKHHRWHNWKHAKVSNNRGLVIAPEVW